MAHCNDASSSFSIRHDVYRYLFNNKGILSRDSKYTMLSIEDFNKSSLSYYWWYILDAHGQEKAVDFPLKIKSLPWKLTKAFHYASRETKN